jgi:hypothetical protein
MWILAMAFIAVKTSVNRKIDMMLKAYERVSKRDEALELELMLKRDEILLLEQRLDGSKPRAEVGEKDAFPSLWNYLNAAIWGINGSTYGQTPMHKQYLYLSNVYSLYELISGSLEAISQQIDTFQPRLEKLGAPALKP